MGVFSPWSVGEHILALDFGSLFRSKNPPLIGLDISSSSVKLVELAAGAQKESYQLERYAIELLPRGALVDGAMENMDAIADAISRAVKKSGSSVKNVAMALPSSAVITKRIVLPADLREEEMEAQVESEANQYIPFAIDEVNLDFQVIGPAANSLGDVDVLIAASRKEKVQDRVAVAEMAGLNPVVMDVESYALRAAMDCHNLHLEGYSEQAIIALFHIGANTTSLNVMINGQSVYEREQAFGGAMLTQDIVRNFGLTFEEAEARKRARDLPENYQRDLLQPFVDSVATEVARALQFFFTSTPYTRIDRILLAGGTAVVSSLEEVISNRVQVPVAVMTPFAGMSFSTSVREKQLAQDAPSLLVATGLALRRFEA